MLSDQELHSNIAFLTGVSPMPSESGSGAGDGRFAWLQRAAPGSKSNQEKDVLEALRGFDAVVLRDFTPVGVETIFRLRALQIEEGAGPLPIPCLVYLSETGRNERCVPGLGRRIRSSWPFRSVTFVADGVAAEALAAEGLAVMRSETADLTSLEALVSLHGTVSRAHGKQAIALQVQHFWGRCGSSTAFANQLDCLIDEGYFTVRVYLDRHRRMGGTTRRDWDEMLKGNTIDSGAHMEVFAGAAGFALDSGADEFEKFQDEVSELSRALIADDIAMNLAAKAELVIVNRAINLGFAALACPGASIVLDTHDYLTRNAFDQARSSGRLSAFPNRAALRRRLALEHRLWAAAEVCTAVSHTEEKRIERYAGHCLMVLPIPYVKDWVDPGAGARWDVLVVADQHFFNVQSVAWFLEKVVSPNPRLRDATRIAIVGRVNRHLEDAWKDRLANVEWLGFVHDLDVLRNETRLTVCPDRGGTGVSVKTLTALAAGQPMAATPASLRGFPKAIADAFPTCADADAMAADILSLIDDPAARRRRRQLSLAAYDKLRNANGYARAIELAKTASPEARAARNALTGELAGNGGGHRSGIGVGAAPLSIGSNGDGAGFLGAGWHGGESWGRWMDGHHATLRLPGASEPRLVEIFFCDFQRAAEVWVEHRGRKLTPPDLTSRRSSVCFVVDRTMKDPGAETVTLDLFTASTHCPKDLGEGEDGRVLGAGVASVSVRPWSDPFKDGGLVKDGRLAIDLGAGGNAEAYLDDGWHDAEAWGRWTDGACANFRLPGAAFDEPRLIEVRFPEQRPVELSIACGGLRLTRAEFSTALRAARFLVDRTMKDRDSDSVTLAITVEETFCPRDRGENDDDRILGAAVESILVMPRDSLFKDGVFTLAMKSGGNADPYLGAGWHGAEEWGRWTDGARAVVRLPIMASDFPHWVEVGFSGRQRPVGVSIACRGRILTPSDCSTEDGATRFVVDRTMKDEDNDSITLTLISASAYRPMEIGDSTHDDRILGVAIESVTIRTAPSIPPPSFADGAAQGAITTAPACSAKAPEGTRPA